MSMLKTVWEAIMRLFSGADAHQELVSASESIIDEPIAAQAEPEVAKPKKQRVAKAKELESMADLLDSLDETFGAMHLPFSRRSWLPRNRVAGLREMGVHVVHPAYQDESTWTSNTVPANRILPAMICVSFGLSRRNKDDRCYPAVLFAIKENKLPAEVSKCSGQHYLFGAGFKLGINSEKDTNQELTWIAGYMTVRHDGSLYLHQELKPRQHTIPVTNPATRRAVGRNITYTSKSWDSASLARLYDEATRHHGRNLQGEGERLCKAEFAAAMKWWLAREENWSVSVKKDGNRITFSIPKELTAKFFKDRIKVTNENGATRRIIHFVSAHERSTGDGKTSVKEHIRGLADFNWKGYACHVTAPKFNGALSTGFTLAGVVQDDDEPQKTNMMDEQQLGRMLSDIEDGRMVA